MDELMFFLPKDSSMVFYQTGSSIIILKKKKALAKWPPQKGFAIDIPIGKVWPLNHDRGKENFKKIKAIYDSQIYASIVKNCSLRTKVFTAKNPP